MALDNKDLSYDQTHYIYCIFYFILFLNLGLGLESLLYHLQNICFLFDSLLYCDCSCATRVSIIIIDIIIIKSMSSSDNSVCYISDKIFNPLIKCLLQTCTRSVQKIRGLLLKCHFPLLESNTNW